MYILPSTPNTDYTHTSVEFTTYCFRILNQKSNASFGQVSLLRSQAANIEFDQSLQLFPVYPAEQALDCLNRVNKLPWRGQPCRNHSTLIRAMEVLTQNGLSLPNE